MLICHAKRGLQRCQEADRSRGYAPLAFVPGHIEPCIVSVAVGEAF